MLVFDPAVTIAGRQLRLRPFRPTDHDALWTMVTGDGRLTGTHASFTREGVDRWYASRGGQPDQRLDLAIATRDGDACVGEVVLNELDADNLSCAFRICLTGPEVFGRGYGTEATRLLLDHAFEVVGLHRIELEVYAFNTRAIHVYERCGFVHEGTRRDALRWDGVFHDALLMSVLAPEWRVRQADTVDRAG